MHAVHSQRNLKQQIVDLYNTEKPRTELIREHDLTASAFDKWGKQAHNTGSFDQKANLTPE